MFDGEEFAPSGPDRLPPVPDLIGYNVGVDRPLDNLVVLGRNLNPDNTLSPTLLKRTVAAVHLIACGAVSSECCFSGGTDWRDAMAGNERQPIGQAMLDYSDGLAEFYAQTGKPLPTSVERRAVNNSNSTAEDLSACKWNLGRGAVLGVLSDPLHHRFSRPALLASKVFGKRVNIVPIAFEESAPSRAGVLEELGNTFFTRAAMSVVHGGINGNPDAVMNAQRRLERFNSRLPRKRSSPEARMSE